MEWEHSTTDVHGPVGVRVGVGMLSVPVAHLPCRERGERDEFGNFNRKRRELCCRQAGRRMNSHPCPVLEHGRGVHHEHLPGSLKPWLLYRPACLTPWWEGFAFILTAIVTIFVRIYIYLFYIVFGNSSILHSPHVCHLSHRLSKDERPRRSHASSQETVSSAHQKWVLTRLYTA